MPTTDEVRLAVPATPEFIRLARLTASGVATRLRFIYDDVADLGLAIDELCFVLIGTEGREGTLRLRYRMSPGRLEIEGEGDFPVGDGHPKLAPYAEQILSALIDDYSVGRDDEGHPSFRLVKRGSGGEES